MLPFFLKDNYHRASIDSRNLSFSIQMQIQHQDYFFYLAFCTTIKELSKNHLHVKVQQAIFFSMKIIYAFIQSYIHLFHKFHHHLMKNQMETSSLPFVVPYLHQTDGLMLEFFKFQTLSHHPCLLCLKVVAVFFNQIKLIDIHFDHFEYLEKHRHFCIKAEFFNLNLVLN